MRVFSGIPCRAASPAPLGRRDQVAAWRCSDRHSRPRRSRTTVVTARLLLYNRIFNTAAIGLSGIGEYSRRRAELRGQACSVTRVWTAAGTGGTRRDLRVPGELLRPGAAVTANGVTSIRHQRTGQHAARTAKYVAAIPNCRNLVWRVALALASGQAAANGAARIAPGLARGTKSRRYRELQRPPAAISSRGARRVLAAAARRQCGPRPARGVLPGRAAGPHVPTSDAGICLPAGAPGAVVTTQPRLAAGRGSCSSPRASPAEIRLFPLFPSASTCCKRSADVYARSVHHLERRRSEDRARSAGHLHRPSDELSASMAVDAGHERHLRDLPATDRRRLGLGRLQQLRRCSHLVDHGDLAGHAGVLRLHQAWPSGCLADPVDQHAGGLDSSSFLLRCCRQRPEASCAPRRAAGDDGDDLRPSAGGGGLRIQRQGDRPVEGQPSFVEELLGGLLTTSPGCWR